MNATGDVETLGGVPVIPVSGTPRTIGGMIGSRLKPRLQLLAQYLAEQLASSSQASGRRLSAEDLRATLRQHILPAARLEPSLWMELESMAHAAGLAEEDLLLIHGYGDLLSLHDCPVPPTSSVYLGLPRTQMAEGGPRMVHVWHLDPVLLPYLTLLRRTPAHGPASLTLTLAGLHPVAGVSEAGLAACSNELRVVDGATGQLTSHLLASALTAPVFGDAERRLAQGPRLGGVAFHLMSAERRASVEATGQEAVVLPDPHADAPRVHTNHLLSPTVLRRAARSDDPTSHPRLGHVARLAVGTAGVTTEDVVRWFGFGPRANANLAVPPVPGLTPETTVLTIIDPATRTLQLKRGGCPARIEALTL